MVEMVEEDAKAVPIVGLEDVNGRQVNGCKGVMLVCDVCVECFAAGGGG
jgi:hypothetical protein